MKRTLIALCLAALLLLPACRGEGSDSSMDAKPVLYLYPEEETEVAVRLDYDGDLTCTYPAYEDGWTVTAQPDGTLTDPAGQTYSYLYWEGVTKTEYDFSRGFCVPGGETAAFLEDALAQLGLTRREANEFIVYWLPRMEPNPYNLIAFQSEAYTDSDRLAIDPEPDSLLRVFMAWRPLEAPWSSPPRISPPSRGAALPPWSGAGRSSKPDNKEVFPCPIKPSSSWTSAGSTTSSSPAGSGSRGSTARLSPTPPPWRP